MTSASASTPSSEEASERAVTGERALPTQPKRGLLASAGERVRRALGGARDKPKAETAVPTVPGAELDPTRTSVRALARSLLQQDRSDPAAEDVEATSEAKNTEVEEPKTIPRAKSVPPPLPKQQRESAPDTDLPLATADEATSEQPADVAPQPVSSRSAQLRARLTAAKAQLAQAQAKLLEAQAHAEEDASERAEESVDLETLGVVEVKTAPKMELVEADASAELPESGVVRQVRGSEAVEAASERVEADATAATAEDPSDAEEAAPEEDLAEFEDLEATELVEEPATATR